MYFYGFFHFKKWLTYEVFLCTRLDSPRAKNWFSLFACVSSRKAMFIYVKGILMRIMMLTIMAIMKTMITTVIILKSMMIKMIMVMIIVITMIIRQWMLKLLLDIDERFLDFSNPFATILRVRVWMTLYKFWMTLQRFLQFVLLGRCWKFSWSIIMECALLGDIPRSK